MQLAEDIVNGINIHALRPGTTVVVETHNSRYRFIVLFDPWTVLVKGGTMFPDDTIVRLGGATAGGSAIRVGWIVVGWRIELYRGSVCITSSPVRSVKVEEVPPRQFAQVAS